MSIYTIPVLGVVTVLLALQLRGFRADYELYLSVACCVMIFAFCLVKITAVFDTMEEIADTTNMGRTYELILIKVVGIAYLSEFCADLCRDSGHGAIAGQIQVFAKLSILAVSMPVIEALLETIRTFTGA